MVSLLFRIRMKQEIIEADVDLRDVGLVVAIRRSLSLLHDEE